MPNNKSNNQEQNNYVAGTTKDTSQPVEMLELFAEELSEQQDMLIPLGCASTAGTFGGSTISSASTLSTL